MCTYLDLLLVLSERPMTTSLTADPQQRQVTHRVVEHSTSNAHQSDPAEVAYLSVLTAL